MSGCHQILTGAVNSGDRSFCLGNIDSVSFIVSVESFTIQAITF